MIANVASVACLLFNIVAIMYRPFSVKALGKALVFANFVVENFDRKSVNSPSLIETFAQLHKTSNYVIPAKAGIQYYQQLPGFRYSPE